MCEGLEVRKPGINKQLEGVQHYWCIEDGGEVVKHGKSSPQCPDLTGLIPHAKEFELYLQSNGKPFNDFWHSCHMIRFSV